MTMEPRRTAEFRITFAGLQERVDELRRIAPNAVADGLEAGVRAAVIDIQGQVKRNIDGPILKRRTGRLWRSILSEVRRRGDIVVGVVGTNVVYAAIHEFGGVIRPKKAGGRLVFRVAGDGDGPESLVFAKSVRIPRRAYMSKSFDQRKFAVRKIMFDAIDRAVANVKNGTRQGGVILPASARTGVGFNAD